MKKHAIIPIFIPHRGCNNACVFCNQRAITARDADITPKEARAVIEQYLPTLQNRDLNEIEVSFFGGSFTGIPIEEQSAFLEVAKEYKDKGLIDKIHLSTRPDYINREILDNLKKYGADVIELGVQSFDQRVLDASKRGHSVACVYEACELIKEYGFTLGIQLMIGLPGDSYESCMYSVKEAIKLRPQLARLYPTVVISGTALADMFRAGEYKPFEEEYMLNTVVDMYRALDEAGILVMRVGLKSTALINSQSDCVLCGYHPAFRQLVEGRIARDAIEEQLKGISDGTAVRISAPEELISNASGHKGCNKKYFEKQYPDIRFSFAADNDADGYAVNILPKLYVSAKADKRLINYLKKNYDVRFVSASADVAKPIACHPDIYMCSLGDEIFIGDSKELKPEYPGDVLYNAARVGKYFICSKYTDKELMERAKANGLIPVAVKQGYVKCNMVVVDDSHVITEDEGIAKKLAEETDIKCLLITPRQVKLPGYEYGFIGGASGRVGNEIIFNGDLSPHPDYERIRKFIEDCDLEIKYFSGYPLTDIGSVIEL